LVTLIVQQLQNQSHVLRKKIASILKKKKSF